MRGHIRIGLAELLRRHHVSQKQLAQAANMRPATINAIVHANVERVELGTLADLISGLRHLGVSAEVGDILQFVEQPDEAQRAAHERALRLLGGEPWGLAPAGLAGPVTVSGPPVEDLLPDLLGPAS